MHDPSPARVRNQSRRQPVLINSHTPDEEAVEAREVHMEAPSRHQGNVQNCQSQVKGHKWQWGRWKSSQGTKSQI